MSDLSVHGCSQPKLDDTVQIIMTERMARHFEERCLGQSNTVGNTCLAGPILFSEDDLPTYIIGLRT